MLNVKYQFKLPENPFLLFSPFLLLYVLIVLIFQTNTLWGDESRYLMYAQNLLQGFYSPPAPEIELRNGPGYPLLIVPFIALHLPILLIKLLNPVFLYLSVVLLFKVLRQFVSFKVAVFISLFWACYYNSYENMPLIVTESFSIFLVSALMFCLLKAFNTDASKKAKKYIYLAGFLLGYIALTKIIFGYVIMVMLTCSVLLWLINHKVLNYRKSAIIFLIAFVTTVPYLIYTYNLTGKIFYWGTSGGNNLYWMATPYKNEYGSWFPDPKFEDDSVPWGNNAVDQQIGGQLNPKNRNNHIEGTEDSIKAYHQINFQEINKYNGPERDDAFKRIAINNIKAHPLKYIQNCISNAGRMLFNYPYSYSLQKPGTLLRFPLTGIIVVLMLFCIVPTLINWRKISFPIRVMLLLILVYLSGSIFGSAEIRMFTLITPLLLFWIAYVMQNTIKIKIKFSKPSDT